MAASKASLWILASERTSGAGEYSMGFLGLSQKSEFAYQDNAGDESSRDRRMLTVPGESSHARSRKDIAKQSILSILRPPGKELRKVQSAS